MNQITITITQLKTNCLFFKKKAIQLFIILISNFIYAQGGPDPPPPTGNGDGPDPPPSLPLEHYFLFLIPIAIAIAFIKLNHRNQHYQI